MARHWVSTPLGWTGPKGIPGRAKHRTTEQAVQSELAAERAAVDVARERVDTW